MASKATGLLQCTQLAADIKKCQGLGKKVLLSLGGAVASTQFATSSEATKVADMLWDLFGGGTNQILDLRPFGDVKLDGFDVGKLVGNI